MVIIEDRGDNSRFGIPFDRFTIGPSTGEPGKPAKPNRNLL